MTSFLSAQLAVTSLKLIAVSVYLSYFNSFSAKHIVQVKFMALPTQERSEETFN